MDTNPQAPAETGKESVPEALGLVALLFPGFLTLSAAEYFAFAPKLDGVQLVAAAFSATLLDVSIAAVPPLIALWLLRRRKGRRSLPQLLVHPGFVLWLVLVSLSTGVAWAYLDSRGTLYKFRVTERASRADVWSVAFSENARKDPPQYVRVTTALGIVYHGNPRYFAEGDEDYALLLTSARREVVVQPRAKARQGRADQAVECIPVGVNERDGAVLILKDQIRVVEFRSAKTDGKPPYPYECNATAPVFPSAKE